MLSEKLERLIEAQEWLDMAAVPIRDTVRAALDRAPRIAAFLHGEWLGHPLHPALVTLPIGLWSASMMLDYAGLKRTGRGYRVSADLLNTIGLAAVAPTVAAGLADFSRTTGVATRVAFVHAATNTLVAAVYASSLLARATRHRALGVGLSTVGFALVGFSGWLGGELSFRYYVGMQPKPEDVPAERSPMHAAAP